MVTDKFYTLLIAKGSFFLETIDKKSHLELLALTEMYVTGYSIPGHQVLVCGGYFGI